MNKKVHYGGIQFDAAFTHAVRDDGLAISFTKSERLLLLELTATAGSVVSRDRLLDVMSGAGSDASDRNVDFVVNRLRRKLGDSARNPAYIATRYGEGYVWVAPAVARRPMATGAYIVVGPARGLGYIDQFIEPAKSFARDLQLRLDSKTAKDRPVVLDLECPPAGAFYDGLPQYAIDIYFLESIEDRAGSNLTGGNLECVLTLKIFESGQVIRVTRQTVATAPPGQPDLIEGVVDGLAEEMAEAIWGYLALKDSDAAAPASEPLPVTVNDAARLFAGNKDNWRENDRRLRAAIERNAEDHAAKLMLATNTHSKYVLAGMQLFAGPDTRKQDEDEIEALVTTSLPHLQQNAFYALAAAKLLFFLDRGYSRLAVSMAESAFKSTTAAAASLTTVGQMRVFLGEIDQGLDCYDQALDLCEAGSEFAVYLSTLKCIACLAAGDRDRLDKELEVFYATRSALKPALAIFFTSLEPDQVVPEATLLAAHAGEAQARAMLLYSFYIAARLFRHEDHRENVMRPPLTLLAARLGYDFVPVEIRQSVPKLFPIAP